MGWVVEVPVGGLGGEALNVHKLENENKYVHLSFGLWRFPDFGGDLFLNVYIVSSSQTDRNGPNISGSSSSMLHPKKISIDTKPNVVLCPLLAKQTQMQQE